MDDQEPLISVEELALRVAVGNLSILDCRHDLFAPEAGRVAYLAGHIPGAVYADLDKDLAATITATSGRHPLADAVACAAVFSRLGIDDDSLVVVYDDRSGAIAARAWWMLRWLGHTQVALLDGGFAAWQAAGLASQTGDVAPMAGSLTASPRRDWIITTDEIMAALADGMLLLDARAEDRFEGRQEPIDSVAGHIPGARNLPFQNCLDASGHFRPVRELSRILGQVVEERSSPAWSVMCGSGVTACHLAVAARRLGLPEPRLYVGSWSEWIRDEARPVATGPA